MTNQNERESNALFKLGEFTMHSGGKSKFKIDCEVLSDEELSALAFALVQRLPLFGIVVPVSASVVGLADALRTHKTENNIRTVFVDDVLTTGRSMQEARASQWQPEDVGAVLFARGLVRTG